MIRTKSFVIQTNKDNSVQVLYDNDGDYVEIGNNGTTIDADLLNDLIDVLIDIRNGREID